jgi:hypothetical protein
VDASGNLVEEIPVKKTEIELEISSYKPGVYYLINDQQTGNRFRLIVK